MLNPQVNNKHPLHKQTNQIHIPKSYISALSTNKGPKKEFTEHLQHPHLHISQAVQQLSYSWSIQEGLWDKKLARLCW